MKVLEPMIRKTNPWSFAFQIGFFTGLFWGAIRVAFYYLDFTTIVPGFLIEPFYRHAYLETYRGWIAGWIVFTAFSIVTAFIYTLLFRKIKGPWPGLLYGAAWWAIIFFGGPFLGLVPRWTAWSTTTWTSELCLFILWGLFQGYTISEEFSEERSARAGTS